MITVVLGVLLQAAPMMPGPWYAAATYTWDNVAPARADWHQLHVVAGRRGPAWTVLAEGLLARRFGFSDLAVAGDGYLTLHRTTYLNVRFQHAPDPTFLPGWWASAELFRAIGRFEVAGRYDRLAYGAGGIDRLTLGLARYLPGWYVRGQITVAPDAAAGGPAGALIARRLSADRDALFEVRLGLGRELVPVGPGPTFVPETGWSGAVRWQRPLTRHVGVSLGAHGAEDPGPQWRWGLSAGVFSRW